jgi:hypothetical protein
MPTCHLPARPYASGSEQPARSSSGTAARSKARLIAQDLCPEPLACLSASIPDVPQLLNQRPANLFPPPRLIRQQMQRRQRIKNINPLTKRRPVRLLKQPPRLPLTSHDAFTTAGSWPRWLRHLGRSPVPSIAC